MSVSGDGEGVGCGSEGPKNFDWLVKRLGSGDDRDQALAFMKMDPTDRMEIMIGSQI
eukprot:COSAG06_NODE_1171_length_10418_cov_8.441216_9_plen_57_part_00